MFYKNKSNKSLNKSLKTFRHHLFVRLLSKSINKNLQVARLFVLQTRNYLPNVKVNLKPLKYKLDLMWSKLWRLSFDRNYAWSDQQAYYFE